MSRLVIAVALTLATAGLALAQQPARPETPRAADIGALADARIAALKAGLKLSAEQERNWPPVEAAIRELARQRAERVAARENAAQSGDAASVDPINRMRQRADAMEARAAGLRRFAEAAEPLYRSLDEDQKRRFALLMRAGRAAMRAVWWQRPGALR
jgi:hypothetical protein